MTSLAHHKHVVSLVGYCREGFELILVFEYMAKGSLASQLFGKGRLTLNWAARMKAAVGSAKGLAHLHEDCHPTIIHCDIKAANILLGSEFEAKIADFGLAEFASESNRRDSRVVRGTHGYIAPETYSSGEQTEKSDTFSFGIVLLELITGRRPVVPTNDEFLVYSVTRHHLTQALSDGNFNFLADTRLENNYNHEEMDRMVACAVACVRESAQLRPRMSLIVRVLEGHQSAADLG
ncbi:hypothetical protein EUGRSUZ_C03360 [Eucalyptus grandis]|nr:hypothetical protein EUGRSUZ_C03360 [Eucalyptus grandis]